MCYRVPGAFEIEVSGLNTEEVKGAFDSAMRLHHANAMSQTIPQVRADVAILAALPKELDALFRSLGPWRQMTTSASSTRSYFTAHDTAGHLIVASQALGMGQVNAALVTQDIVRDWRPRKLILIGIAGGLGKEVQLGDVVVSEQVVDYELGKITPKGTSTRWRAFQCDAALIDGLKNFRDQSWTRRIAESRPDGQASTTSSIRFGTVLSGNKVIADAATAGDLEAIWTRAAAIEMEAAGVAAALHQIVDAPGFVMVKGVCDRADEGKSDDWQNYAAEAAAVLVTTFLVNGVPSKSLAVPAAEAPAFLVNGAAIDGRSLRALMAAAFTMNELRVLVDDLGIDWEEIPGDVKSVKINELLKYVNRRGGMPDVVRLLRNERPHLASQLPEP
jgi:nucleoside phosphorylase